MPQLYPIHKELHDKIPSSKILQEMSKNRAEQAREREEWQMQLKQQREERAQDLIQRRKDKEDRQEDKQRLANLEADVRLLGDVEMKKRSIRGKYKCSTDDSIALIACIRSAALRLLNQHVAAAD